MSSSFGAFEALLQGGREATGFQVEKLAMAGRRAAQQFVDHGVPLNDTLTKEASGLEGVQREHVQRMCETANHTTFNSKFAQAEGDFRAPDFEVADPSTVWDRVQGGGTEKTASADPVNLDDYRSAPRPFYRSRGAEVMQKTAAVAEQIKRADPLPKAFPMAKAMEQRTKLSAVRDELASRAGQYELSLNAVESQLISKMAEALKEGHAPEELLVVFGQADGTEAGAKHASRLLVSAVEAAVPEHRRGQIKLAFDEELTQHLMTKEASTASPIYRGFADHKEVREELATAKLAHQRVVNTLAEQRKQLLGLMKDS